MRQKFDKTVIGKTKDKYLLEIEREPANVLSTKLINEALYGDLNGKTLKAELKDLFYYDILSTWTSEKWINLLEK